MNRRKGLIAALLLVANSVFAQSLDEGVKALYYEKYQSAKQILEKVAVASPSNDAVYYYLGEAELGLNNKNAARADFQKGLQVNPKSGLCIAGLAQLDVLEGKYADAKQKMQNAFNISEGRDFEVGRAILVAAAASPKADNSFALDLMKQIKENRKNRNKDYSGADWIAIGDAYRNMPNGGGPAASAYENVQPNDPLYARARYKWGNLFSAVNKDLALKGWNDAIAADSGFAPAYYALYEYYYTPRKNTFNLDSAKYFLQKYVAVADKADQSESDYQLTQVMFLSGDYKGAAAKAKSLLATASESVKPKLYRLLAVAQSESGDPVSARTNMEKYFQLTEDRHESFTDYKNYSDILKKGGQDSLAVLALEKGASVDTTQDMDRFVEIADAFKTARNFDKASHWYKKVYDYKVANKQNPNIIDLYNWGYWAYYAGKYGEADSVFSIMINQYPETPTGYYLRGLVNAAMDSLATTGQAKPYFDKYIQLAEADIAKDASQAAKYKASLTKANTYLAVYHYNQKEYDASKGYCEKLLALNPGDQTAKDILDNISNAEKRSKASSASAANNNNSGRNK